jgi:gamma-glutamylcysteine synthetase
VKNIQIETILIPQEKERDENGYKLPKSRAINGLLKNGKSQEMKKMKRGMIKNTSSTSSTSSKTGIRKDKEDNISIYINGFPSILSSLILLLVHLFSTSYRPVAQNNNGFLLLWNTELPVIKES